MYQARDPHRRPFYRRHPVLSIVTSLGLLIVAGAAVAGVSGGQSKVALEPAPVVTQTGNAPVEPTATSAPEPAATLLSQDGHGSEATRAFTSNSGNYLVSWTYSGNGDSFGPSNFIMTEDGGSDFNSLSLPDDIASIGHGSTEVTNDSGSHKFNVQSVGDWTVKVVSEP